MRIISQGGDLCRANCLVSAILLAFHSVSNEGRHLTQANTKPSYLDPNRDYMQKPIGGRSLSPLFNTKNMLKTRTCSEPIWILIVNVCRKRGGGVYPRSVSVVFPLGYPRADYDGDYAHYADECRVEDCLVCLPEYHGCSESFADVR